MWALLGLFLILTGCMTHPPVTNSIDFRDLMVNKKEGKKETLIVDRPLDDVTNAVDRHAKKCSNMTTAMSRYEGGMRMNHHQITQYTQWENGTKDKKTFVMRHKYFGFRHNETLKDGYHVFLIDFFKKSSQRTQADIYSYTGLSTDSVGFRRDYKNVIQGQPAQCELIDMQ